MQGSDFWDHAIISGNARWLAYLIARGCIGMHQFNWWLLINFGAAIELLKVSCLWFPEHCNALHLLNIQNLQQTEAQLKEFANIAVASRSPRVLNTLALLALEPIHFCCQTVTIHCPSGCWAGMVTSQKLLKRLSPACQQRWP